jgi:hypothetical protein
MKRFVGGLALILLAGCADLPSAIRIAVNPELNQPMIHTSGGYTFNPYTGEYVGAEPPGSAERREEIQQYAHDRTQNFIRRHWVPGHTVLTDRGDLIITENGVVRFVRNPWRNNTVIEP